MTESLLCLEVDHKLVLGRRLHRKVGRFLAAQDAVDIARGATQLINGVGAVADQAAIFDEVSERIDGGQPMARGKLDDQFAMNGGQAAWQNNESTIRRAGEIDD